MKKLTKKTNGRKIGRCGLEKSKSSNRPVRVLA